MNPLKKRSRSLFDEMESMPDGNYQESYERRGGPRVGAEEMFEQMNMRTNSPTGGMLSDPNMDPGSMRMNSPTGGMIQNMPYTHNPNMDPRDTSQNMPYNPDPSMQGVDPQTFLQMLQMNSPTGGQNQQPLSDLQMLQMNSPTGGQNQPLSENEMLILQQLMQQR
jgi:hypothetical protein